jgi:hypothetical protein
MLTQKEKNLANRILMDFLFNPHVDFDEILVDDVAYRILSDENVIETLRKKFED